MADAAVASEVDAIIANQPVASPNGGLGDGAIAGIIIGCVGVPVTIALAFLLRYRRKMIIQKLANMDFSMEEVSTLESPSVVLHVEARHHHSLRQRAWSSHSNPSSRFKLNHFFALYAVVYCTIVGVIMGVCQIFPWRDQGKVAHGLAQYKKDQLPVLWKLFREL